MKVDGNDRGANGAKNENKLLLFIGLGLSAAAFLMAVVPVFVFFVPGGASSSSPLVYSCIYVNAFAVAAALAGVILTALSASRSVIARLNLFFAATAFLVGLAFFVLCLVFGAIIPLHTFG